MKFISRNKAQTNKFNELKAFTNESEITDVNSCNRRKPTSETHLAKRIVVNESKGELHAVTPSITHTIANSIVVDTTIL